MIKRPENLLIKKIDLTFNFIDFYFIELDFIHINQGRKGLRKNALSLKEVMSISKSLIHNEKLIPAGIQEYEEESCSYYTKRGSYKNKEYKIVFCICSDRPNSIGIITLFRTKGSK